MCDGPSFFNFLFWDNCRFTRNNTESSHVPFTQFPLMETSCKILLHHNQGIDIDTVELQNISVTTGLPPVALLYSQASLSSSPLAPPPLICSLLP